LTVPDILRTVHINTERTFRGGERQVLLLMRGLIERGHEASLIAQPSCGLAERAEEAGITVHKIKMRFDLDPLALALICAKLRGLECDIVHMHTGHAHTLGVVSSLLSGRGRRIVSRRVVSGVGTSWLSRLKYRRGVNRYIAISEAVKKKLLEAGVAPARVSVVNSCIDLSRFEGVPDASKGLRREFGIPEAAPVVGAVGALVLPKGFHHFIDAVSMVVQRVPQARFVLVGDGELRQELEHRAAALGLGRETLVFTGWRDDVPELLKSFDVLVSSSIEEGLGTSVLQALATKKPVVVTDAGGLPEIVADGENGLVVPAGEPRLLADGIVRLLNDASLCVRMADAGYQTVRQRFTPARMVEGTIAVYREVLGEK